MCVISHTTVFATDGSNSASASGLCPACAALNFRMRHASVDLSGRVALLTGDPTRTLFTMALAALLNAKAAREEDYLSEMHGADVYGKYATEVPRLIPRIDGMKAVVQDFADGFEQKE